MTISETLTLAEAQSIAESIIGACEWNGAQAFIECPGKSSHTTRTAPTDCKVVAEKIGTLAPGVYCFHDSCQAACDAASHALRSALGKRSPSSAPRNGSPFIMPTRPAGPEFDPAKLERIARKLDGADADWLAERSPTRPHTRTPASFLHKLYQPGEKVVIFDVFESQGQALWTHRAPPFDACELDGFRTGKSRGVWFLANPVTGDYLPNDNGHPSRRSWQNTTAWHYMVLESDKADPAQWLAVLAQMPLPIAAVYTSGGKSIHALVRLDAESKAEWDEARDRMMPWLVTLGADRKALSAVRLTRLPCCERLGADDECGTYHAFDKPRLQRLLYLNPSPDLVPICEMPIQSTGYADGWQPADQDSFDGEECR